MKAGCIREAGELCILAILTGMAKCWSRRFLLNTASKYRCGWPILDALFLTTLLKDRHPRVLFFRKFTSFMPLGASGALFVGRLQLVRKHLRGVVARPFVYGYRSFVQGASSHSLPLHESSTKTELLTTMNRIEKATGAIMTRSVEGSKRSDLGYGVFCLRRLHKYIYLS